MFISLKRYNCNVTICANNCVCVCNEMIKLQPINNLYRRSSIRTQTSYCEWSVICDDFLQKIKQKDKKVKS